VRNRARNRVRLGRTRPARAHLTQPFHHTETGQLLYDDFEVYEYHHE
jgi:hypothetical protein